MFHYDSYVFLYDLDTGIMDWEYKIEASDNDFLYSVVLQDEYYYFTGRANSNDGDIDRTIHDHYDSNVFISKVDLNGNEIWNWVIDGKRNDIGADIIFDDTGEMIVSCYSVNIFFELIEDKKLRELGEGSNTSVSTGRIVFLEEKLSD